MNAPSPPSWLLEASMTFLRHVAEPMYWLLAGVSLLTCLILLWQKQCGVDGRKSSPHLAGRGNPQILNRKRH